MKAIVKSFSGGYVDIFSPRPEHFDLGTIAHVLSGQNRFNGHTEKRYTVAEHCVRVSEVLPRAWRIYGLLHEADEVFMPDIPGPFKRSALGRAIDWLVLSRHRRAASSRYGLEWPWPKEIARSVKVADLVLLATEARDLFGIVGPCASHTWRLPFAPLVTRIEPWSSDRAELLFLSAFRAAQMEVQRVKR